MLLGICRLVSPSTLARGFCPTHLEENNAERQKLLPDVELVLGDTDIPEEEIRQSIAT